MAKLYTCDNCGNTSPWAYDEELYKDINGVLTTYDLCAPCRGLLDVEKNKAKEVFFGKIKKGKK